MSKSVHYLVTIGVTATPVSTIREVSELLGRKVTKAMIAKGEVPEVEDTTEDINTDELATDDGAARVYVGDDTYEELPLINPLDGKHLIDGEYKENIEEDDSMKKDNTINLTEEDMIEEIINNTADEDLLCDDCRQPIVAGEPHNVLEDGTVLCHDCYEANEEGGNIDEDTNEDNNTDNTNEDNASNNEDKADDEENTGSDDKPKDMATLLAKMKELNHKKALDGTSSKKSTKVKKIEFTGEYPEVGAFKEKKELQKFYKQLDNAQLDDWIELEGLTYKASDNEPIDRMRKCMAILSLHFPPETTGSTKKKSKYGDYTTEALLEMALENDIEVPEAKGNTNILRMYTIMALKKAGLME